MRWVLIRHGQTQGNLEHRYIGCRTDEPLCTMYVNDDARLAEATDCFLSAITVSERHAEAQPMVYDVVR